MNFNAGRPVVETGEQEEEEEEEEEWVAEREAGREGNLTRG